MTHSVVGKNLPRVDGPVKATGQAKYSADMSLPGMLSGMIKRSPYPHARILNIDTSRAERHLGVKCIITGADIPKVKYGHTFRFPQLLDEYLVAVDKVRYMGESVAAVAAVDEDAALEAIELIRVEYEPLPAVLDPEEAMKPGAPLLHDNAERNISVKMAHNYGDVEAGFAEADHIREDRFVLQPQAHAPLEPHAVLASADHSGKVTVWSAKQSPFRIRYGMARTLDVPDAMVRMIHPKLGGGFGGKCEIMPLDFCAAFLSRRTGRPVRIVYTLEESLCTTRSRHPMVLRLKTGVKKDGTLTAISLTSISDGGAYRSSGAIATSLTTNHLHLPYRIANLRTEGYRVYTNKQSAGAMRGHGTPQPRFAMECQLDMIAEDLGLDPIELRLRNAIESGHKAANGAIVPSCGFKQSLREASTAVKWKEGRESKTAGRGLGVAAYTFGAGSPVHFWETSAAMTAATISLKEDGTVHLVTGASDIGQGSDTILCQIAAEELGVNLDEVTTSDTDTDLCPLDWGTSSSRVTYQAGNAVLRAARDARQQILEAVADKLEARPEDLDLQDHRVFVKGSPDRGMLLREALAITMFNHDGAPVVGRGAFDQSHAQLHSLQTGFGNFAFTYVFGTQVADVEVDRETGQVDVRKMTIIHDCGQPVNPMAVEGQVEGSAVMGSGYAIREQLDRREGTTFNPSFTDYKLSTAMDSCQVTSACVDVLDPGGPYGAKEAGEGLMVGAAPAIANAVYNAIGVRIKELPITPEKVLKALNSEE